MPAVTRTARHTIRCGVCSYWFSPASMRRVGSLDFCRSHQAAARQALRAARRTRQPDFTPGQRQYDDIVYPDGTPAE